MKRGYAIYNNESEGFTSIPHSRYVGATPLEVVFSSVYVPSKDELGRIVLDIPAVFLEKIHGNPRWPWSIPQFADITEESDGDTLKKLGVSFPQEGYPDTHLLDIIAISTTDSGLSIAHLVDWENWIQAEEASRGFNSMLYREVVPQAVRSIFWPTE